MKSSHATAAAQIRAELKANFPGFKFSVNSHSYTGGDSIRVKWTDGPSYKKVNEIVSKYQAGHFNGMEDIYEYGERVEGIEQVKYVFAERTVSEQNKKAAQISLHIPDEEMNAYWSEQQVYRKCQETSYDMEGNVVVEPVEVISEPVVTVTENPTEQIETEIKIGTHFWALMDDLLIVMLRCKDGFYVCGGWEGDIPIEKFEFVAEIKKPNNTKLYYQ